MAGSFEAGLLVTCKVFIEHARNVDSSLMTASIRPLSELSTKTLLGLKAVWMPVESKSVSGKESGLGDP